MNICNNVEQKKTVFTRGNLYKSESGLIAIYNEYRGELTDLATGLTYSPISSLKWVDVTDQYCLQKVK